MSMNNASSAHKPLTYEERSAALWSLGADYLHAISAGGRGTYDKRMRSLNAAAEDLSAATGLPLETVWNLVKEAASQVDKAQAAKNKVYWMIRRAGEDA